MLEGEFLWEHIPGASYGQRSAVVTDEQSYALAVVEFRAAECSFRDVGNMFHTLLELNRALGKCMPKFWEVSKLGSVRP